MRKRWLFTLPLLCLLFVFPATAANQVTEIAVDVTLENDGSAYVVQTWNGNFDEGTECYFPVTNLGEMHLSDLKVSDGSKRYTTLDSWDTGGSFADKAGKCGLNPVDGGYEVCWGITNYGEGRYAVEYRLDGLVAAYEEADGFLFQFVPEEMNTGPTDVTLRIQMRDGTALTEANAAVWAFGFQGQVGFSEKGVFAYTEQPLTEENSVILMLRLNQGMMTPTRTVSGSFEELKNRALEDSDYGEQEELDEVDVVVGVLVICIIPIGIAVLIFLGGKEKRRIKKLYQSADYWREAPIGGNLEASFVLANRFHQSDDDGNLVAAALTRLLAEGCLEPQSEVEVGFFGREKKRISLQLVKEPPSGGLMVRMLYELLTKAAGSDGILQENELENYCKSNYSALLQLVEEGKRDGSETLSGIACYRSNGQIEHLAGLSERGRTLLLQLIGYKKYLLDFSLIAEREVEEALIWQDCLTYAALFGSADKVMEQLRKLYPANVSAYAQHMETTYYVAYRYNHLTYQAARSAQAEIQRTSGGGGYSSLGGGGGFSGGGSGGGTR